jgi:predicted phosphodiesterase
MALTEAEALKSLEALTAALRVTHGTDYRYRVIAIISDVHANLEALMAVLKDIESRADSFGGIDQIACIGDIVGYGPNPNEVLYFFRKHKIIALKGNHDEVVTNPDSPLVENTNKYALESFAWTRKQLSKRKMDYLINLPWQLDDENEMYVHGAPCSKIIPEFHSVFFEGNDEVNIDYAKMMQYCDRELSMELHDKKKMDIQLNHSFETLIQMKKQIGFVGHSHFPKAYQYSKDPKTPHLEFPFCGDSEPSRDEQMFESTVWELRLMPDHVYIINPGAVGQPRDGDRRASYGILDRTPDPENGSVGTFYNIRVPYNQMKTIRKMLKAGISYKLAYRLIFGK